MKALILAGGRGSRLEGFTEKQSKCMYHFAGRPLIEYSLENACQAGAQEIIIVVGYMAESIINHYGNRYEDVPIRYVIQWERKGVVHAIQCSKETIDGDDFMLFLADEILLNPRHREMLEVFHAEDLFAMCGIVRIRNLEEVKKTYAVIFNEDDHRIYRLIEKPRRPINDIMGTGNCIFRHSIFDYIGHTPVNPQRGEKELPDLIQCAIDDGNTVKLFDIGGRYINVNSIEDLVTLNRLESTING